MGKYSIYNWHFEIPLSDVESEVKIEKHRTHEPCLLCGKPIKQPKFAVRLLTNGNLVSHEQEMSNCQGYFAIGSECKNRLPNNFIFNI